MKIAYTMNGLIGGLRDNNSTGSPEEDSILVLRYISNLIDKNIREHNDIDVFVFSWHTNFQKEFTEYLSPVVLKLMPQKQFSIPKHLQHGNVQRVFTHKSRWYGYKEVIKLVEDYEKENNFEYDFVVNARFDICWNKPFDFKKLDTEQFHIPYHPDRLEYGWPGTKEFCSPEILDHIFASNSKWMRHYATMFDFLDEYTLPGQCKQWNTISNHFLMVWHLGKLGLLTHDIVEKSFSNWSDKNPRIIGGSKEDYIDYDIFRYRHLDRKKVLKELEGK